jgi:hypothetical protein
VRAAWPEAKIKIGDNDVWLKFFERRDGFGRGGARPNVNA